MMLNLKQNQFFQQFLTDFNFCIMDLDIILNKVISIAPLDKAISKIKLDKGYQNTQEIQVKRNLLNLYDNSDFFYLNQAKDSTIVNYYRYLIFMALVVIVCFIGGIGCHVALT